MLWFLPLRDQRAASRETSRYRCKCQDADLRMGSDRVENVPSVSRNYLVHLNEETAERKPHLTPGQCDQYGDLLVVNYLEC